METLKRKLTSRKLWMSIASFVTMILIASGKDESWAKEIAAIVMAGASVIGYVIGEGLADSKPENTTITVNGQNAATGASEEEGTP